MTETTVSAAGASVRARAGFADPEALAGALRATGYLPDEERADVIAGC